MGILHSQVQPGQFKSLQIIADGKNDITEIVVSCNVYQDIFTPTWTGKLMIMDATNTQHTMDIHVGSEIEITIQTESPPCSETKSFKFIVNNISEKTLLQKTLYGYKVSLVDEYAYKDIKTRVSKSYTQMSPPEIVNKVLSDSGMGSAETDDDPTKYDVIVPNMTPFTTVQWISRFAKPEDSGADFTFFQKDSGGKFAFKSLEKMFKESSGYKLKHKEANYRVNGVEDPDNFIIIQKYQFISEVDGLRNLAVGFFGSSTIAHDIVNKKIVKSEYTYAQDTPEDLEKKPWKGKSFENVKDSVISFMTLHDGMTSKTISMNETHDVWKGSRKSQLLKLDTNRLILNLPGAACLWKVLGKTVDVELPPQEDLSKERLDKYFRGDYLVTAINHMITPESYHVALECSKKRLEKKIEE